MYSTSSMLRTMELILGLDPMSQFDAAARPMYATLPGRARPRARTSTARPASTSTRSTRPTPGAPTSPRRLDLAQEDAADDLLFNEIIWRSVKGADSPMPPPVRAAFVVPEPEDEDDEDDDDD